MLSVEYSRYRESLRIDLRHYRYRRFQRVLLLDVDNCLFYHDTVAITRMTLDS